MCFQDFKTNFACNTSVYFYILYIYIYIYIYRKILNLQKSMKLRNKSFIVCHPVEKVSFDTFREKRCSGISKPKSKGFLNKTIQNFPDFKNFRLTDQ